MKRNEPYEIRFVECPQCGYEQADMGNNVKCEDCGFGPMPTGDSRCDKLPDLLPRPKIKARK